MKFRFKKLSGLIATTVFAVTTTAVIARDFRSADVHSKDFPTNVAVKHMGETSFQKRPAANTTSRCSAIARWAPKKTPSSR